MELLHFTQAKMTNLFLRDALPPPGPGFFMAAPNVERITGEVSVLSRAYGLMIVSC